MIWPVVLAASHFFGIGLAFLGSGSRIVALRALANGDIGKLKNLFMADNVWGLSAILLLATGFIRAFTGVEKGGAFYLNNAAFYVKLAVFLLVFALEVLPMITLIRWRMQEAKGRPIAADIIAAKTRLMLRISVVQFVLLVLLVFTASTMARGLWMLH